jgi:hypothetical protein
MELLLYLISGKKIINPLQKTRNLWIKILMPFGIFNGSVRGKVIKEKVLLASVLMGE